MGAVRSEEGFDKGYWEACERGWIQWEKEIESGKVCLFG